MSRNGGYNGKHPRFTAEQRADWGQRYDRGESVPKIAREYGCSSNAVYHYLTVTGRYEPGAGKVRQIAGLPGGACIRCGIDMGRPGMCLDCCESVGAA